jgi:ABC-type transport system involved in cytochrome c biogenesis permease subunit
MKWGYIGKNSVIMGTVFVAFALFTGSLWFNATSGSYQNIYWSWNDPRMVTTLILLISYIAYLIFGSLIDEREKKYRLTSILGIILFPTIPLSYLSATIFNSLHPLISSTPGETGHIYWEPLKFFILFFNLIAITILYIYLVMELIDLDKKREELDEIIQKKMEED